MAGGRRRLDVRRPRGEQQQQRGVVQGQQRHRQQPHLKECHEDSDGDDGKRLVESSDDDNSASGESEGLAQPR